MAGLLGDSFDDPRTGAVLQAAMGLLGGGSNAQRFAGAGNAYFQAMQAERAKKLREEEIRQQMAAREQLMQQQRAQMEEAATERAKRQGIERAYGTSIVSPQQQALGQFGGPTRAAADAVPGMAPRVDQQRLIAEIMKVDPVLAAQMLTPKEVEIKEFREVRMPDGSVQIVGLGKDGKPVNTGQTPFKAPEIRDFGGNIGGIDPITGKVITYGSKSVSPDAKLSADTTRRGQDLTYGLGRDRLAWEQGGGNDVGADPTQAALIKRFGKPEPGRRWKADGSLEAIPGGSADLKAQAGQMGKGSVGDVVTSLRDMYNQLDEGDAITNPEKGPLANLAAGTASSGPGQAVGRLFGTQSQSLRNTIAQQRPLLLQAIMKATGMSAKQMDSNAELKLYLATATDPTLDVASNRRALDMIERLYGSGEPQTGGATGGWDGGGAKPTVKFLGFE